MKTLADIQSIMGKFEEIYKMPVAQIQQGSAEWLRIKLGVLSASNASKIVAKKDSETRATYMAQLVAQVCTGISEEINSKHMEWGKLQEDPARSQYEFMNEDEVTNICFIFNDDKFREGVSPDGLIFAREKGFEIKCPYNSENYIKFVAAEKIKPEWKLQNQMTMRVTGAETWDFIQYDPRVTKKPMHVLTIERDEEMQKTLADAVPQFIHDMDKMLEQIGVSFGDQWRR